MKNFELISFSTGSELTEAVANSWLDKVEAASRSGEPQYVALSGGRIARGFFTSVAELAKDRVVSFAAVHFFWADERCVPPTDSESNFRAAEELLVRPLKIQPGKIHRILGEQPPDKAAEIAAAEIQRVVSCTEAGQPVLDIIFLGMGEDGHVASLFPGEPQEVVSNPAIYRAVVASKPPPCRITLGYSAIAAARRVWVLASGAGKEAALRESLSPTGKTPLARLLRLRQETKIFADIRL